LVLDPTIGRGTKATKIIGHRNKAFSRQLSAVSQMARRTLSGEFRPQMAQVFADEGESVGRALAHGRQNEAAVETHV